MLILKSTDNLQNADLHNVLGGIKKLADQVCWCCKDVENICGRIDLKKLPEDLHPREIRKLYDLLHHDTILVCMLFKSIEASTNKPEASRQTTFGRYKGLET